MLLSDESTTMLLVECICSGHIFTSDNVELELLVLQAMCLAVPRHSMEH